MAWAVVPLHLHVEYNRDLHIGSARRFEDCRGLRRLLSRSLRLDAHGRFDASHYFHARDALHARDLSSPHLSSTSQALESSLSPHPSPSMHQFSSPTSPWTDAPAPAHA
jgi:hypothetical protein